MRGTTRILLAVAAFVALIAGGLVWWMWFSPWTPLPATNEGLTQLARIDVPSAPDSLAWSPEGNFLAAGYSGSAADPNTSEVFVVDIAKRAVAARLKAPTSAFLVAFSPDGTWLAVGTSKGPADKVPAEVMIFNVPAFAPKFQAKTQYADGSFVDIAWSADSKTLHAIDAAATSQQLRHWSVPAFAEGPAIKTEPPRPLALALAPDGKTLATAEQFMASAMIRLYDLEKGAEKSSFKVGEGIGNPRLGFTADGKTLGLLSEHGLSWWDTSTGKAARPNAAKYAVQAAGSALAHHCLSPDGLVWARAHSRNRDFGDIGAGWDGRDKEFGAFINFTDIAADQTQTWRVGNGAAPPISFSPDSAKLAGTISVPAGGGAIVVWQQPK